LDVARGAWIRRVTRRMATAYKIIPNGISKKSTRDRFREEFLEYPEMDSHHENHLLLQLPILIIFGADFPVEM
jgi:hypothetical protein